jgi:hypothetical protein
MDNELNAIHDYQKALVVYVIIARLFKEDKTFDIDTIGGAH